MDINIDVGVTGEVTLLREDREYAKIQHDKTITVPNGVTGQAHLIDLLWGNSDNQHLDYNGSSSNAKQSTMKLYSDGSSYSTLVKTLPLDTGYPHGPGPTGSSPLWTGSNPGTNSVKFQFADISVDNYNVNNGGGKFMSGYVDGTSTAVEVAEVTGDWDDKPNTENWYWQWTLSFTDNTDTFKTLGMNALWDLILNRQVSNHNIGNTHMTQGNMGIYVFKSSELTLADDGYDADTITTTNNTPQKAITTTSEAPTDTGASLKWKWESTSGAAGWEQVYIINLAQLDAYTGSTTFDDAATGYALYRDSFALRNQGASDTFTYTFTLTLS